MSKLKDSLKNVNLGLIINIGLIILILSGSWFIASKLGIIKSLNADIEKYENQIEHQDKLINEAGKLIDELDKKNIKLTKKVNKLTGKYNDVTKGTSMDDAIKLYNSQRP